MFTPSLVPGPSHRPVFDRLQYVKMEGEGLVNLTTWSTAHMMSWVLDTRKYEARGTRQVPAERQVLPLEHNRVRSRTVERLFHYKHCKSKSGFFLATLATFCHCGDFTHDIWQPFRVIPSSSYMFCTPDVPFSFSACLIFVATVIIRILRKQI